MLHINMYSFALFIKCWPWLALNVVFNFGFYFTFTFVIEFDSAVIDYNGPSTQSPRSMTIILLIYLFYHALLRYVVCSDTKLANTYTLQN